MLYVLPVEDEDENAYIKVSQTQGRFVMCHETKIFKPMRLARMLGFRN